MKITILQQKPATGIEPMNDSNTQTNEISIMSALVRLWKYVGIPAFLIIGCGCLLFSPSSSAQGTTFTYQGSLTQDGNVVTGLHDFEFRLYDAASGGSLVGLPVAIDDVVVTNGLFHVMLDFGDAFNGSARFLSIAIRPGESNGDYTNLVPRQSVTPAPMALHARSAAVASWVAASNVLGTILPNQLPDLVLTNLLTKHGTNDLIRVWNPKDYGATGANNKALDTAGFDHAISNWFRFGGRLHVPRGEYWVTTTYELISHSTNSALSTPYADMELEGDGMGASIINLDLTNAVWLRAQSSVPSIRHVSFRHVGSGSTMVVSNSFAGYGSDWYRVGVYGFTNGAWIGANMGFKAIGCEFEDCFVGLRIPRYTDGLYIDSRASRNVVGVVLGGQMPAYPEQSGINAAFVRLEGTLNHYNVIVGGNSRGAVISGYGERPQRAAVAAGYPLDLFPAETNAVIPQLTIRDLIVPVNYSNRVPLLELKTTVQDLHLENVFGGRLIVVTNANWAAGTHPRFVNAACTHSFMDFDTTDRNVPSLPFSEVGVNRSIYVYGYASGSTNLAVLLNSAGVRINGQLGINSQSAVAPLTLQASKARENWLMVIGTTNGANTPKTGSIGVIPWDGGNTPQTAIYPVIPSADLAVLNLGGGTSFGKPFAEVNIWAGNNPAAPGAGAHGLKVTSGSVHILTPALQVTGEGFFSNSVTVNGDLRVGGTISQTSDRNAKSGFAPVDSQAILTKVLELPIQHWNFLGLPNERHLGPMAQDFHAAFGLGAKDNTIATVDADGVALAAIQGLNQKLEEKLAAQATEIAELKRALEKLSLVVDNLSSTQE